MNDFNLKPSSVPELNALINLLKINEDVHIKIEGHTYNTGDSQHNIDLSFKRANAVKIFLQQLGIEKSRIEIEGLGSTQHIANNDSEKERQMNRRTRNENYTIKKFFLI